MTSSRDVTRLIARKGADPKRIADAVARNPEQLKNTRPSTRKKAEQFMKKHEGELA